MTKVRQTQHQSTILTKLGQSQATAAVDLLTVWRQAVKEAKSKVQ
jgi:hypothetical protein